MRQKMDNEMITPLQMALIIEHSALKLEHGAKEILEPVAVMLETSAKTAIGTYRFGWPPLAESTLARKAADTPLLETGELRDSIQRGCGLLTSAAVKASSSNRSIGPTPRASSWVINSCNRPVLIALESVSINY
jgi:hypothetical protein